MVNLPEIVRIKDIRVEARKIRTFVLDARVLEATPGQFIMLWLPGVDEKPFAIAHPDPLILTIAQVGPFSTSLHQREVGDQVGWRGPYGHGFSLEKERSALLVAGGYGAAPLYFLASQILEHNIPTTVVLGAQTAFDLPYVDQFQDLGADLILCTDDGSVGHKGYVSDVIRQQNLCSPMHSMYACGPEEMLVSLHRMCLEREIPGQFSVERYMKCGFGVCGQCALDDLLVCQDGPVFTAQRLDDLQDFGHVHHSATGRRLPIR